MDAPAEPVAEAAETTTEASIDQLPDAGAESAMPSFEASLEEAFSKLENAASGEETAAETETEPAAETETEPSEEPLEPLEQLTDEVGDDWTPKAANRFKQLKAELKTNRSELDELRQKATEYEQKVKELSGLAESHDVETLQSKIAEYEQQQMFSNLEATDAYRTAVTDPLTNLMEQADQIADKYEIDGDALVDVLAMDDPNAQEEQLSEILAEASDRDKAKIYRIIEDIDPILERRSQLFENADAALAEAKQLEEQKVAQQAAEKAQIRQNVVRNVVERVQQKLPFLSGLEGLDMSSVQQRASETDPSVAHPVDMAYNAVSAQILPSIVREYVTLQKEVDALTDRLAEYEDAEPSMSGAVKESSKRAGVSDTASFEERVNAALGAV